jgi:signal transduction histidine kinase/DNA-binding response OmpR family regulator
MSEQKRTAVLSSARIKIALIAMVVTMVAVFAGLICVLVEQIFGQLTPRTRDDLVWKAERGAAELSYTCERGILTRDAAAIKNAAQRYLSDHDVIGIVAADPKGAVLFSYGAQFLQLEELFAWRSGKSIERSGFIAAWMPSEIEGTQIGKVGIAVSTKRLQAGKELKKIVLTMALAGCLVALLSALVFVNLRIVPLLKVTEAAFGELEVKTEAALEASRVKSEFIANMSRELGTPLNRIVVLVGLMIDMELDNLLRRYVQTVDVTVRGLTAIVSDILDFSKIEAGKLEIRKRRFEPHLVAQEVAELNSERAHSKGLEIVCWVAPDVPASCVTDPERFGQVLTNLVGNAIKFTEFGEVLIRVTRFEDSAKRAALRVEVADTGIGIKDSDKHKLFETFSQVESSSVRRYGGAGLGLAISKQLIYALDGEIGVDSQPGVGSTFWFTVPIVDPVHEAASATQSETMGTRGRRALIVDGNEHARRFLRERMVGWGMTCTEMASGLEALDLLEANTGTSEAFDVVVIAAKTADTTGEEFLQLARFHEDLKTVPLVFLRQRNHSVIFDEISDAITAEVNKPVRPSELLDAIIGTLYGKHSALLSKKLVVKAEEAEGGYGDKVILIVDDNEINLIIATELVERQGYGVATAKNGEEAVKAVLTQNVAMVLMDCQMPVMDGYEATRQIRLQEPPDKRTPIIALTAHALVGERDKCLKAGMDDYLTKPIRPDYLHALLKQYMSSDEQARAKRISMREMAQIDPKRQVTSERVMATPKGIGDEASPGHESDTLPLLAEGSRSTRLIELFLSSTPPLIDELEKAVIAKDHVEMRAKAHKLKGSFLAIEAPFLAAVAAKLQMAAEAQDFNVARDDVAHVRRLFAQVEQLFNKHPK